MDAKTKKKRDRFLMTGLSLLLLFSVLWGLDQHMMYANARQRLENEYQRNWGSLLDGLEELSRLSAKVSASGLSESRVLLLEDIRQQSGYAQEALSALPLDSGSIVATEKYLNQLGDYAYSLRKKAAGGESISAEEQQTLYGFSEKLSALNEELQTLAGQIDHGQIDFYSISDNGSLLAKASRVLQRHGTELGAELAGGSKKEETPHPVNDCFGGIEDKMAELPAFNYDGAFSEHMCEQRAACAEETEISAEEAEKIAADFCRAVGETGQLQSSEGISSGSLPLYCFSLSDEAGETTGYLNISVHGGHPCAYLSCRTPGKAQLSREEAAESAEQLLKALGFGEMEAERWQMQDDRLTIAFLQQAEGVLLPAERLLLQLSLEDGSLLALSADEYWQQHRTRTLTKPMLSEAEARARLNPQLEAEPGRLLLLPNGYGGETLCWAFRGGYDKHDYLVCINAENGNEEDIRELCESENGLWTY